VCSSVRNAGSTSMAVGDSLKFKVQTFLGAVVIVTACLFAFFGVTFCAILCVVEYTHVLCLLVLRWVCVVLVVRVIFNCVCLHLCFVCCCSVCMHVLCLLLLYVCVLLSVKSFLCLIAHMLCLLLCVLHTFVHPCFVYFCCMWYWYIFLDH
jgi:hypothetical protein